MSAPLLPCPFCGAVAEMVQSHDESLFSHAVVVWYEARCSNPLTNFTLDQQLDCPGYSGTQCEDLDEVTANWNRRHVAMQPGRWFRINTPDGSLWMETSDEAEARSEALRTGWALERLHLATFAEWRVEAPDAKEIE